MKHTLSLLFLAFIFSSSCSEDDSSEQLLDNNELEEGAQKPIGWNFFAVQNNSESLFDFEWSADEALSGDRSMKIEVDSNESDEFGGWTSSILFDPNGRVGKEVELTVWVKAELAGEGATITIRGDDNGEEVTSSSSQLISGDFDWGKAELSYEVTDGIDALSIFFTVSGPAQGEVYFDNVSLKIK